MSGNTRAWRAAICLMVCLCLCSGALAVSGGQLAIARAFGYAYNNPTWGGNYGANTSTSDFAIPRGPGGAVPSGYGAPLMSSTSPFQPYAPMSPVTIISSGGGAAMAPSGGYAGNPIIEGISVLAGAEEKGTLMQGPYLTSLAPDSPASIRGPMLQGEADFRAGRYEQATVSFETARKYWGGSPEVLLSLAHVGFAQGGTFYTQAASNLSKAFKEFPDLLLARARPQEFFGSVQEYDKALAALQSYTQANPKNAATLLLLGYVQWRAGQVEQADRLLQAAVAAGPSKEVSDGIAAMQVGMRHVRQMILLDAPALDKAQEFAWAGIRLAVPSGFRADPLTSPNQVLTGLVAGKDVAQLVSLYAYPMGEGVTLKAFMDTLGDSLHGMPFVKDMHIDAEAEVPFLGGTALVRLFTYTAAPKDSKIVTGWVVFTGPAASGKSQRVAYLLGTAGEESQAQGILPTLAAMSKTIALAEPVIPSPTSLDLSGNVVENEPLRFSIVQPMFWAGRRTDRGYEMGQTDLVQGGVESPRVEVVVQTVAGSCTAESFGQDVLQRTPPAGITRKLLSKGPAKLAGQDGYQFVVSQSRQDDAAKAASTLVGRLICLDAGEGRKTIYALVVDCRGAEPKDVEALAEKIAADFKLLPPVAEKAPAGR